MHLKPDLLRAYIDGELAARRAEQVEEHLTRCPACRKQLDAVRSRADLVAQRMAQIAVGTENAPHSPQAAFSRFSSSLRNNQQKKEIFPAMFKQKRVWTALAVIAVLAIALSLTPVRAWASDFLSLFRVEKVTVIQFDPEAARQMEGEISAQQEAIERIVESNLTVTREGETTSVASIEEAAAAAGFTPRIPTGMENPQLAYEPGAHVSLTIDQPQMQAIFDAFDMDVQLPEEVDGKSVEASLPTAVVAAAGCEAGDATRSLPENCTGFVQMPSPTVDAPEGLDMQKTGAALFELLGYTKEEAARLSQNIDWTTTLVLPVPITENVTVSEMPVDGVTGTLVISNDDDSYTLVWVNDGMLYALRGYGGANEAAALAATMP